MKKKTNQLPPLENGLLTSLRALDNQIARAQQRSPAEVEKQGVQKWDDYNWKIEEICSFLLEQFGENTIELDSLLILAQAAAKTLQLVVEDLGEDGLGKLRTLYCLSAFEKIGSSAARGTESIKGGQSGDTLM